jgi:uncharacterized DUF497 family protein
LGYFSKNQPFPNLFYYNPNNCSAIPCIKFIQNKSQRPFFSCHILALRNLVSNCLKFATACPTCPPKAASGGAESLACGTADALGLTVSCLFGIIGIFLPLDFYIYCIYNTVMIYAWDENKNIANFTKHGFYLAEGKYAIEDKNAVTILDDRKDYGEKRYKTIGAYKDEIIIVAIHAKRDVVTRIISVRRANKKERRTYYDNN